MKSSMVRLFSAARIPTTSAIPVRPASSMTMVHNAVAQDTFDLQHELLRGKSLVEKFAGNDRVIEKHIHDAKAYFHSAIILSLEKSLETVRKMRSEHQYSESRKQLLTIIEWLEGISKGPVSTQCPVDIKKIAFEAYILQGIAFQEGTLEQNKMALEAFKKALKLEPHNPKAVDYYESLAYSLGILHAEKPVRRMRV
jgi:tetratricopeptide (TPR) repeat protein